MELEKRMRAMRKGVPRITATGVLPNLQGRKIYPLLPGKHEKNYINSSNQIRKGDKLVGEVSRIVAAEAWHWTWSLPRVKFMNSTQLSYTGICTNLVSIKDCINLVTYVDEKLEKEDEAAHEGTQGSK
ncbi:hypothetical protein NC653_022828 [Populus alba x Populus x berolinensis]|uniref:Uncharacterized protein n=1 Tax=Populus alba x Populus x berolinensis TaxID=444605 RepID=A0AAD6QB97_9ROSI|nr:hypothetical protein NC653_022815 [Populus alba x Populus x berolinensis]KAJ6984650.1 hypothetical protein NC653_022828 [Populus alba x Populus x berolinensis]